MSRGARNGGAMGGGIERAVSIMRWFAYPSFTNSTADKH